MPKGKSTTTEDLIAIPAYDGYFVRTDGTVWSMKRGTLRQRTPQRNRKGYLKVGLNYLPGKQKFVSVHHCVLWAFRGPCPEGLQARHLDDNKENNTLENLVWGTVQENNVDKRRNGRIAYGERMGNAVLTAEIVAKARLRAHAGEHFSIIANEIGVGAPVVSDAIRGINWAWLNDRCPPYLGYAGKKKYSTSEERLAAQRASAERGRRSRGIKPRTRQSDEERKRQHREHERLVRYQKKASGHPV